MENPQNPIIVVPSVPASPPTNIGSTVFGLLLGTGIFYLLTYLRTLNFAFLFLMYGDNDHTWFPLVIVALVMSIFLFVVPYVVSGFIEHGLAKKNKIAFVMVGLILNTTVLLVGDYRTYQRELGYQAEDALKADVHTIQEVHYSFGESFVMNSFPVLQIEGPKAQSPTVVAYRESKSLETPPLPNASTWMLYTGPRFATVSLPYITAATGTQPSVSGTMQLSGQLYSSQASYESVIGYARALDNAGWFYTVRTPSINGVTFPLHDIETSKSSDPCPAFTFPESILGIQNNQLRLVLIGFRDTEKCPVTLVSDEDARFIFISDITDFSQL